MLTIYGSDLSSPANKVRFTANLLGLKYEYIKVNLRAGESKTAEYLKMHPAGKIPAMDDNGFVLFESGAIVKYLASKNNSSLYPQELKERATIDQWMDFSNLHVGDGVVRVVYNRLFAPRMGRPVDENSVKTGLEYLDRFLPIIDAQLGKHKYLTGGALTLADITLLAVLDPVEVAGIDIAKYKNINSWRDGLKSQDFYTTCHKDYGESLLQPSTPK